jgi:hypothetical protein
MGRRDHEREHDDLHRDARGFVHGDQYRFPNPSLSERGNLPSGVTFIDHGDGTATLSGTAAAGTAGSYPLTLTAHHGIGSDATQSFTLVVSPANHTPTWAVTNGQCSSTTASGTIDLTLDDLDIDPLTLTLVSNSKPTLLPNKNVVLSGAG